MNKSDRNHIAGVLVVDKPRGPTSFGVVQRIRKITGIRKVGHTGTLDPLATGVLPLCFNRATKLVPFLQAGHKEYSGRMILGITTDTDDVTGRVTAKKAGFDLHPAEIIDVAAEFVGAIEQAPPAYSAIKFNGRPSYELARRGEKVPVKSREIVVHELSVTEVDLPYVSFRVRASKGTYVRSLAADLGRRLRTGACLESLRRLSAAPFSLKDAVTMEEVEELAGADRLDRRIIPLDRALSFLPEVCVSRQMARMVSHGQPLPLSALDSGRLQPGPVRIEAEGQGLLAVYEYNPPSGTGGNECLIPLRVLGSH